MLYEVITGDKKFVHGPWKEGYELGTYGIDPKTGTAWAVINYNGEFAVARDVEPVPGHCRIHHQHVVKTVALH